MRYYFVLPSPQGYNWGHWSRRTYRFYNRADRDEFASATYRKAWRRKAPDVAALYVDECRTYDNFFSYWFDRISNSWTVIFIILILWLVAARISVL